jgi:hypothetical protein
MPALAAGVALKDLDLDTELDLDQLPARVAGVALALVRGLAFDWHLVRARERVRLAGMLCGILASALRSRSGSRSGVEESPAGLKCGHIWAMMDPSMVWWQRLLSGE